LLDKLAHYGIRGSANNWFKSYLENRRQYVQIGDAKSSYKPMTCGVPQGSILGPLLFLLYINELPSVSMLLLSVLFADDTTVYLSGNNLKELEYIMNQELKKISNWFHLNRLSLNADKSNFMIFRVHQKPCTFQPTIYLGNTKLSEVHSTTFLGVKIDSHLNWNTHVNHICNKIAKANGIIYSVKNMLPTKSLLQLYHALIQPYLNYCTLTWMSTSKTNKIRLQTLQKRAVRSVLHLPSKEHSLPLFSKLKLLPIHNLTQYRVGIYAFKNRNTLIKFNHEVHSHNTRASNKGHHNYYRTSICKNSIKGQVTHVWNTIPIEISSGYISSKFQKEFYAFCSKNITLLY